MVVVNQNERELIQVSMGDCCVFQGENFQREKQLVKDAAEFLVLHQIPTLVRLCLCMSE